MGIIDEYNDLKSETDADLLAMQVGDFYEFFSEDAEAVSRELGLKLSQKSSQGGSHPMAGVPIEDLPDYVETLVDKNDYIVAVADQYETERGHAREITRVVTPGTLIKEGGREVRYLAVVNVTGKKIGIALTDLNSGQVLTRSTGIDSAIDELAVYNPVETVISYSVYNKSSVDSVVNDLEDYLDSRIVRDQTSSNASDLSDTFYSEFGERTANSVGLDNAEVSAVGRLIQYLESTKTDVKNTISRIKRMGDEDNIKIDARTRYSLEIAETMGKSTGKSLFDVLDHTVTTNGGQKLQKFLQRPLTSKSEIVRRQQSVSSLVQEAVARRRLKECLESTPNVQRIASKSAYGSVTPLDLQKISTSIDQIDQLTKIYKNNERLVSSPLYDSIRDLDTDKLHKVQSLIRSAIIDDPPNSIEEGIIRSGFDDDLDKIVEKHEKYKSETNEHRDRVSDQNDITHVSVGRNKTDGMYIQVGNSEKDKIPEEFDLIKNLKNSYRYKSEKIRECERHIIRLEEQREEREEKIFEDVVENVTGKSEALQKLGEVIAQADAIRSLAVHAVKNRWTKPDIEDMGSGIDIQNGRHPVVEQSTDFVPNDSILNDKQRFLIVTGPNMAGKSTYLRQIALNCILAQSGSFVPAESASIGIIDSIFARVGSSDEISKGRSTFMVEMSELANILHSSTDNSLVILDEVGRGTATYDGYSIAKATIEYLSESNDHPRPMTLFATHYHELTELSSSIGAVQNFHLPVRSSGDDYQFTHKVVSGAADESYGIRVADMAGVPDPVIERSSEILDSIKEEE